MISFAAACLLAAGGMAADDAALLRWSKTIEIPQRAQEELVAVPLDSDVYAATGNNLADLRVFDAAGRAVPFLLRVQTETRPKTLRRTWTARDPALKPLDEGGLEIRISLNDDPAARDPQPTGLRIVTPLKNFEQRVRVFGIDAAGVEKPLVEDALIFDYSQYMDVGQLEISAATAEFRKFRLVVEAVTSNQESQLLELSRRLRAGREEERQERTVVQRRPFRIDRVEFLRDETRERFQSNKEQLYPVERFTVQNDDSKRQTIVEITTRREPLAGFRVETSSRNFSRRALVQVPRPQGVQTVWSEVGSATISRFEFRNLQKDELRIPITEQREEKYRVVIENRDSPPLEITGVSADGYRHELVFLAAANADYRLGYGAMSDEARPPDYDTAALSAALNSSITPVAATLGEQTAAAPESAVPFNLRRLLNNPILIGGVILVLVIALGWGLYHAGQRIEKLPPGEE